MTASEKNLLLIFLLLPAVLFGCAFVYVRSKRFQSRPIKLYKISLLGQSLVISTNLLIQGTILLLLYAWLDFFFPLPLAFLVAAMAAMSFIRFERFETSDIGTGTEQLLDRLSRWQKDIVDVKQHVEAIQYDVLSKQIELNEKDRIRQTLDEEISKKSEEAKVWASMSQEQKELFLSTTFVAMKKESRRTFWLGLFLGFLMNIMATITWTMMGNPGREQIMNKIRILSSWKIVELNKKSDLMSAPLHGSPSGQALPWADRKGGKN